MGRLLWASAALPGAKKLRAERAEYFRLVLQGYRATGLQGYSNRGHPGGSVSGIQAELVPRSVRSNQLTGRSVLGKTVRAQRGPSGGGRQPAWEDVRSEAEGLL